MKLQKQLSRRVGDTEYSKYVTVIPPEVIKQLNWKDGEELDVKVREGKLVVEKKK